MKIGPGVWLKVPLVHNVKSQSVRLRVATGSVQTITSRDGITITLRIVVGFTIQDIIKLYDSLDHPDLTIMNIAMGEISDVVAKGDKAELTPSSIQTKVEERLNATEYGLKFEYIRITNYAIVKTYRLIGDHNYIEGQLNMDQTPTPPR